MIIREARPDDVVWLLEQLRAFDQFFGAGRSLVPSDPMLAHDTVAELVTRAQASDAAFYIAVLDGTRVGFIAGVLMNHPFNPEIRLLSELFWWVDPAHRGSSAGARLLARFEEFGRKRADWITMTLEAKSPVDPSSLTRRGYRHQESSYLLEVGEPDLSHELPEMAVVAD